MKFDRWTVIGEPFNDKKTRKKMVRCKCECGTVRNVSIYYLKNGLSKSCGCLKRDKSKERAYKHGKSNDRIYKIYKGLFQRCYNVNNTAFDRYGGRGIKVCDEWSNDFKAFYDWAMSNGYEKELTLDRIDNDGDYSPNNCRWVTNKVQSGNKRTNIVVEKNGERYCLKQYCELNGLNYDAIKRRILLGWEIERAIREPIRTTTKDQKGYTR